MADNEQISILKTEIDDTNYQPGAKRIIATNKDLATSAGLVDKALTQTKRIASDGQYLDRLERQYRTTAGEQSRMAAQTERLNSVLERHPEYAGRAGAVFEAMSAKLEKGAGVAHSAARSQFALNMAMEEGEHVVRSLFDSIAAGQSPMRAFSMEAPRIAQGFGMLTAEQRTSTLAVARAALPWIGLTAAVAGAALAYSDYAASQQEVERASRRGGNATGFSTVGLNSLAGDASSLTGLSDRGALGVVGTYASTGRISSGILANLTKDTQGYADLTGQSAQDAAKDLSRMFEEPGKGADELAAKIRSLSAAELDRVKTLAMQGDLTGAQTIMERELGKAAQEEEKHLGGGTQAWRASTNTISNIWHGAGRFISDIPQTAVDIATFGESRKERDAASDAEGQDSIVQAQRLRLDDLQKTAIDDARKAVPQAQERYNLQNESLRFGAAAQGGGPFADLLTRASQIDANKLAALLTPLEQIQRMNSQQGLVDALPPGRRAGASAYFEASNAAHDRGEFDKQDAEGNAASSGAVQRQATEASDFVTRAQLEATLSRRVASAASAGPSAEVAAEAAKQAALMAFDNSQVNQAAARRALIEDATAAQLTAANKAAQAAAFEIGQAKLTAEAFAKGASDGTRALASRQAAIEANSNPGINQGARTQQIIDLQASTVGAQTAQQYSEMRSQSALQERIATAALNGPGATINARIGAEIDQRNRQLETLLKLTSDPDMKKLLQGEIGQTGSVVSAQADAERDLQANTRLASMRESLEISQQEYALLGLSDQRRDEEIAKLRVRQQLIDEGYDKQKDGSRFADQEAVAKAQVDATYAARDKAASLADWGKADDDVEATGKNLFANLLKKKSQRESFKDIIGQGLQSVGSDMLQAEVWGPLQRSLKASLGSGGIFGSLFGGGGDSSTAGGWLGGQIGGLFGGSSPVAGTTDSADSTASALKDAIGNGNMSTNAFYANQLVVANGTAGGSGGSGGIPGTGSLFGGFGDVSVDAPDFTASDAGISSMTDDAFSAVADSVPQFNFADGGIMTSRGSLPLRRYASGGIASTPQLAMYGEGDGAEAYVPLPDGRSIPVTMDGGGDSNFISQGATINNHFHGGAQNGVDEKRVHQIVAGAVVAGMAQARNGAVSDVFKAANRGGQAAKALGRRA